METEETRLEIGCSISWTVIMKKKETLIGERITWCDNVMSLYTKWTFTNLRYKLCDVLFIYFF